MFARKWILLGFSIFGEISLARTHSRAPPDRQTHPRTHPTHSRALTHAHIHTSGGRGEPRIKPSSLLSSLSLSSLPHPPTLTLSLPPPPSPRSLYFSLSPPLFLPLSFLMYEARAVGLDLIEVRFPAGVPPEKQASRVIVDAIKPGSQAETLGKKFRLRPQILLVSVNGQNIEGVFVCGWLGARQRRSRGIGCAPPLGPESPRSAPTPAFPTPERSDRSGCPKKKLSRHP